MAFESPAGHGDRLRDLCRRLVPFLGPDADRLYLAYLGEDKQGREEIEQYLQALAARHLGMKLSDPVAPLVPPGAAEADGSYRLGTVVYAGHDIGPFGLREREWIQHVGVFGRTGAGKTNLGYLMVQRLREHGKPFLLFDWKRSYRDLSALPGFENLRVYTPGRDLAPLSFNPLVPPAGTPPKTWLKKIIEVIAHAYMLGNGVLFLLQESVNAVYERFGVYAGQCTRYPTIRDVMDEARSRDSRGREAGWLASTMRALSSMCFGDMDTVVNQGGNQRLAEMLEESVILELDALTQADKVFFIQALLLWIHHFRMAEGRREHFKHAILIEEAHHVLSGERRSLVGGQSVTEITFREIREFGESIIILDQHPSQICLPALGNTYSTICLNLKHSRDVSTMGQCMLMKGDEKDILGELEVGQAVVKLQGRAPRPFQIRIPEFPISKGAVTDVMVRDQMAGLVGRGRNVATYPETRKEETGASTIRVAPNTAREGDVSAAKTTLSVEITFLADIRDYPESGIAERYKRLGVSVRQGQKLKARMAADASITETLERTRTGSRRVVRLTEKGARVLESYQKSPEEAPG